jgi:hypothetical protein
MLAQNDFFELLQHIDEEFLGAILVIATVGIFITAIVTVVALARTVNNVALTRMQHSMVKNLLAQGYSVEDTERLAYGNYRWGHKLRHFVHSAKTRLSRMRHPQHMHYPMPPVKQNA